MSGLPSFLMLKRLPKVLSVFCGVLIVAGAVAVNALDHAPTTERGATTVPLGPGQLGARTAQRHLDPKQQAFIAEKLSAFAGERADLTWYPNDGEAGKFAADIESALNAAHWKVFNSPFPAGENGMPTVIGVAIFTMPNDRSQKVSVELFKALLSERVAAFAEPLTKYFPSFATANSQHSTDPYETRVLIVVGNHP